MRDFPELINDHRFINSLNIQFNSNELFEEWKHLNNLSKRADISSNLNSNIQDAEGTPYFSTEWIVRNIMKLSDEEIAENEKYKMKERSGLNAEDIEEGGEGGGIPSGPGGDYFGGGDSGGGGDDLGGGDSGGDSGGDDLGGSDEGGAQDSSQMELGGDE